jgi:hypothetical protein
MKPGSGRRRVGNPKAGWISRWVLQAMFDEPIVPQTVQCCFEIVKNHGIAKTFEHKRQLNEFLDATH